MPQRGGELVFRERRAARAARAARRGAPNDRPIHSSVVEQVTPQYTPGGRLLDGDRVEMFGVPREVSSEVRSSSELRHLMRERRPTTDSPHPVRWHCCRRPVAGARERRAVEIMQLGSSDAASAEAALWRRRGSPTCVSSPAWWGHQSLVKAEPSRASPPPTARQSESCRPRTPGARGRGRVRGKAGAERCMMVRARVTARVNGQGWG